MLARLVELSLVLMLLTVGLSACTVLACAVWPQRVERSRQALQMYPLRCWLSGLLAVLVEVFFISLGGGARVPLLLVFLVLDLLWLAQGFPALASLTGERLGIPSRASAVAAGSTLVALAGVLPVVGWLMAGNLALQAIGAALQRCVKEVAVS